MTWFYNLKIANKLMSAFFIVIVFVIGLGSFAISQLGRVDHASSDVAENWLPDIRILSQMQLTLSHSRILELRHLRASDVKDYEEIERTTDQELTALAEQTKHYESLISEPEEKTAYPVVKSNIDGFLADHKKVMELSRAGQKEEANALMNGHLTVIYRQALTGIGDLLKFNNKGADDSRGLAISVFSSTKAWIMAIVVFCVIASILLALMVARTVSRPLREAVTIARQVADGDLTADIQARSTDETGELMTSLRAMNDNLLKIVGEVRAGTDTIATASGQIAAGNLDLSSRTEEQASSLEEAASAIEELTATVKQNADNAVQANQLASSASAIAVEGGSLVGQVVNTMEAMNRSSKKIADIISVIDGIAFQTNILALNAAVEAARAGEQGRGFAVVASEVRSLAQRSATAAKEIKTLIEDSVSQVDSGSQLVARAGETMDKIVLSVKRVTDIVAEIATASQEQSDGIGQVNQTVTQIDQVTQQNAALVEEASAAAHSLQEQADKLSEVVGFFKLSNVPAVRNVRRASVDITPKAQRLVSPSQVKAPIKSVQTKARSASLGSEKAHSDSWETF